MAVVLARAAIEGAHATGQPTVECEALEIIGRAERGRDLAAAEAAFQAAHDLAARARLRVWQARAMQELGTIDMFGSLSPSGCWTPAASPSMPGRWPSLPWSTCSSPPSTRSAARSPRPSRQHGAARNPADGGNCRPCR